MPYTRTSTATLASAARLLPFSSEISAKRRACCITPSVVTASRSRFASSGGRGVSLAPQEIAASASNARRRGLQRGTVPYEPHPTACFPRPPYLTPAPAGVAGRAADGGYNWRVGLEGIGRVLIGGALVLLVLGVLFLLLGRLGLDRLPGDLVFRRGNLTVFFPIGVMIVVSVVATLLLNVFLRR